MLTLTSPHQTWAHSLPAGGKMAALCLWTAGLFSLHSLPALTLAAVVTAALVLSGGARFAMTSARLLRPLWPFVLIVALWHLWLAQPATGAAIVLRLLAAVAAANFVTMTTRLSDMIAVIAFLARPLRALGLSPRLLALAVALVIRFIPVMLIRPTSSHRLFAPGLHVARAGASWFRPCSPPLTMQLRWPRLCVPVAARASAVQFGTETSASEIAFW